MSNVWHILKVIRGALIFTLFYVGGGVFGLLVCPIFAAVERDERTRQRRVHRAMTGAFVLVLDLMRWARIMDFDPRRVARERSDRPRLIVVNHPSTVDVVAVLSVYRDAVVVIKEKIWNDRFLRRIFKHTAHVSGGDGTIGSSAEVLELIRARLAHGFDVVIFPEGTRSPPGGLATFMKGAFAIASRTKTDVAPVVITVSPPILHKDAPWYRLPAGVVRYRLRPLPTIDASHTSAHRLMTQSLEQFRAALALAPLEEPSTTVAQR